MSLKLALSTLVAAAVSGVVAQTSLYIPGFDPQAISVSELGVGSDGETTWLLAPGASSGTLDVGLPGPATLVAGASAVSVVFDYPAAGVHLEEDCTIVDGVATCNIIDVEGGMTTSGVETETVSAFAVQGGGATAAPASGATPAAAAPTGGASSGAAAGASTPSGASQTSSGGPQPTQTQNGVSKLQSGAAAAVFAVGMSLAVLL